MIDAIGGIAAAILAIIGLTGFDAERMAGIATIVLGAAVLVQGGTILSEYAQVFRATAAPASADRMGGDGLAATFMLGAGELVLGVLALFGMVPVGLTAIAVLPCPRKGHGGAVRSQRASGCRSGGTFRALPDRAQGQVGTGAGATAGLPLPPAALV